ncbi:MAG: HAD hydrolase-like protein [Candidatus Eisenbacteria bacterium]
MRVIGFDIDGTLLLSGGAGARALDRAFEELLGVPDAFGGIHPHGMTDDGIVQEMGARSIGRRLTSEEIAAVRERYAFHMPAELRRSEEFRIMPGVPELLERLSKDGDFLLGLVTGNYEKTGRMKLAHAGLEHHFRFGGWGTDSADRFELTRVGLDRGRALAGDGLSKDSVFLVGDTVHDVRCGLAAGAVVIAVATGPATTDILRAEGAHHALEDLTDTEGFLGIVG